MTFRTFGRASALAAAVCCALCATSARAASMSYFVAVDGLATFPTGTYAGKANPNFGHLTFLWGHPSEANPSSSHYHAKSTLIYTGPAATPTVIRSASNYVPEAGNPPLKMFDGTGLYAGKLVTATYDDAPGSPNLWADLTLGSTQALAGAPAGTPDAFLFTSSAGRWDDAYPTADVHWQLVSRTPGLNIGDASSTDIGLNAPGDERHLGGSDDLFGFTPILWTDADAAPGIYEATFRLVDATGTYGDSGDVRIVTQIVPEPATLGIAASLAGLVLRRRQRHRD